MRNVLTVRVGGKPRPSRVSFIKGGGGEKNPETKKKELKKSGKRCGRDQCNREARSLGGGTRKKKNKTTIETSFYCFFFFYYFITWA